MKKIIISILIFSLVCINLFVNKYTSNNEHVWNLIYYFQFYFVISGFMILIWVCFKDMFIRSLTFPLGIYYIFHLVVQTIEIFNPTLKQAMYTGKIINYILAASCGVGLLIYPLIIHVKKHKNP